MTDIIEYSFVIPAFNEQESIPLLFNRLLEISEKLSGNKEYIFVNDGSSDQTLRGLTELSVLHKSLKIINLSRNFGHQAALSAGLRYASGNAVISMDCDLQDPPEVILDMIDRWKNGFDVVYARRLNFREDNFLKKIGSKIFYKLMGKFSHIRIPRNVGDFRLVDKRVLRELNKMPEHARYLRGMVAWTGFKHCFVDYMRPDRAQGKSGYTFAKLATLGMDGMFNFSMLPLRLGFLLGIVSIIAGFGLLFYQIGDVLINKVYYHLYKWLIVVLFIFMGFMFLLLWILGEYIGKIYDDVRNRPLYVIENLKNFDNA